MCPGLEKNRPLFALALRETERDRRSCEGG